MPSENLEVENQKLKELIEQKSDLISISAHELRTSLTALKWILKMFLDRDLGDISAEQESMLEKAFESNERLISLVNELLSANRSADATISYKFEETDIIKLIDETIFDFIGESYKERVEIIFLKPREKVPFLKIDAAKIRVVFQNLIENSIKYSNHGDKIFISIQLKEKEVEFSVKDTGIGIKDADQTKIFTKFFRADNAKQKKEMGTGLGLLATKNITLKHGGKIWFESAENKGSTFYFTLPI